MYPLDDAVDGLKQASVLDSDPQEEGMYVIYMKYLDSKTTNDKPNALKYLFCHSPSSKHIIGPKMILVKVYYF